MGVVKRQGIKNTISSYVGILLGFVSLLIIQPRFLKPEEIGLARVLFAFATLVSTIIPFGITNITVKYFSHFKDESKRHHGFLGFVLLFFLIGFIVCASGLFIFQEFIIAQYRKQSPLIIDFYYYILPFSFFLALINVLNNYLITLFKSTVPSYLTDVWARVGFIAVILLYSFGYFTLQQFIGGYVAVYAVQVSLLVVYLLKVDKAAIKIDWEFLKTQPVKEMIQFGLLLSTTAVAAIGLKTLDAVFLGKYQMLSFVGIYTIAAFIPTIIEAPLNALDRIVVARVAQSFNNGNFDELRNVYYQSVKYLSLIGGLLFAGVVTNITFLLNLIGKEFAGGVQVVYIIAFGSLVTMLGGSSNALLIYTSKPWQGALMLVMLVVITVLLNMLLIPHFGMNGAALSTAISAILFTTGKFYLNYSRFKFQPYNWVIFRIVLAILISTLIGLLIPSVNSDIVNILLRTTIVSGVYVLLVYLLKIAPELLKYVGITSAD